MKEPSDSACCQSQAWTSFYSLFYSNGCYTQKDLEDTIKTIKSPGLGYFSTFLQLDELQPDGPYN